MRIAAQHCRFRGAVHDPAGDGVFMRRKIILLVGVALLFPSILPARSVSEAEALNIAQTIIRQENSRPSRRSAAGNLSIYKISSLRTENEMVGYLAKLSPRGFMILSDITEFAPLRFIAYDAEFQDLREHSLIHQILADSLATKQKLGYATTTRSSSFRPELTSAHMDEIQAKKNEQIWERMQKSLSSQSTAEAAEVGPLLTSRWTQDFPYNMYTPMFNNNLGSPTNAPTGCSATAQAQVMYYWKYPAVGKGQISYQSGSGEGVLLSRTFNTPYDWSSMLDAYTGNETDRQKAAVASLMRDVGYSIQMGYSLLVSGSALNGGTINSLARYFRYSSDAESVSRSSYSDTTVWFNLFKDQMEKGWPALITFYAPDTNGHSAVVDGYKTSNGNQVHINLGWGGSSDAYYALDSILRVNGDSGQQAVINIHPLPSATYFPQIAVGGAYTTIFTFGNSGSEAAFGTLSLIDQNGNPFTVNGLLENPGMASQVVSGSSFDLSIPPGGVGFLTISAQNPDDPARAGWAHLDTQSPFLYGVATFQYFSSNMLKGTAGVLATAPTPKATIPMDYDVDQGRQVGYAIANPEESPITIKLTAMDQKGIVVDDSVTITLNPGEQIARYMDQDFTGRQQFKGTLLLSAQTGSFVVVALMQNQGQLTVVPVIGTEKDLTIEPATTHIAGANTTDSGDGGPAVSTQLGTTNAVAVDAAGNLYIADAGNYRIRKVTTNGIITTIAGTGSVGYSGDNGPATYAQIGVSYGMAVDASGNIYIADTYNNIIRKVTSKGIITTVAGTGSAGYAGDNSPAVSARLSRPQGVAVDAAGNLYIADTGNYRIRKVRSNGIITTIAGTGSVGNGGDNGPATSAQIGDIGGVAADAAGNVYIADGAFHCIRKVTPAGIITTVAGTGRSGISGNGGPATSAQIGDSRGVAVDAANNIYIADSRNASIRKVTPEGIISTVAGAGSAGYTGDDGPATSVKLNKPYGVAVDTAGNVYIADTGNYRIRKVTSEGIITTVAGNGSYLDEIPAISAKLNNVNGLAADVAGNLFIADTDNHRIRKITPDGIIKTVVGTGISGYDGDGHAANSAQIYFPRGVAIDSAENIYIADSGNNRIRKVSPDGNITTVAGNGTLGFGGDGGSATSAQLNNPHGVAVDPDGNLYIADTQNNRIRKVTRGIITTVAGNGTYGYSGDGGAATSAKIKQPYGTAVDSHGNLYIADTFNQRIRKVTPDGIITTAVGNGSSGSAGDGGPAASASLVYPYAVVMDAAENLYIADSQIRRVTPDGIITTLSINGGVSVAADVIGNVYYAIGNFVTQRSPSRTFASQIAAGGGYSTVFTFGNSGSETLSTTVKLTDQEGNPFVVSGKIDALGTTIPITKSSSFIISIPPGCVVFATITALSPSDPARAGWAQFYSSTNALFSDATFQYAPSGILQTAAGVLSTTPTQSAIIPVDMDADQDRLIGYAAANPGDSDVKIRLTAVDMSGSIVSDYAMITLKPGEQVARFLDQDYGSLRQFKGSIILDAQRGNFTAAALVQNQGLMTVIPVVTFRTFNLPN
jgi:sugar lactone lactonase YvrE